MEGTFVPATILLLAIGVRLDSLPDGSSRKPIPVVGPSIGPRFDPCALGLTVDPLTDVDLTVSELALALEELRLVPLPLKNGPVSKNFESEAFSFAVGPVALVPRPIFERLQTVAVRHSIFPFSFVCTAVCIFANSKTVRLSHVPQTVVDGPVRQFFDALAMEKTIFPFAIIHLAVFPLVDTFATWLVFFVVARETAAINIDTLSCSLPLPIAELAFVVITARPDHLSNTMGNLGPDFTLVAESAIKD